MWVPLHRPHVAHSQPTVAFTVLLPTVEQRYCICGYTTFTEPRPTPGNAIPTCPPTTAGALCYCYLPDRPVVVALVWTFIPAFTAHPPPHLRVVPLPRPHPIRVTVTVLGLPHGRTVTPLHNALNLLVVVTLMVMPLLVRC